MSELGSQALQGDQEEYLDRQREAEVDKEPRAVNNRSDIEALREELESVEDIDTSLEVQMDKANADKFDPEGGSSLDDDDEENIGTQDLSSEQAFIELKIATIKGRYQDEKVADCFNFKSEIPVTIEDFLKGGITTNDHFLLNNPPLLPFSKSIEAPSLPFKDWACVSGFNSKTTERTHIVERHRPVHGVTEGGKGISYYTRPVVATTAGMSTLVNVVMASSPMPLLPGLNFVRGEKGELIDFLDVFNGNYQGKIEASPGRLTEVVGRFSRGKTFYFKYTLDDGTVLYATDDHELPLYSNDDETQWGQVQKLPISTAVSSKNPEFYKYRIRKPSRLTPRPEETFEQYVASMHQIVSEENMGLALCGCIEVADNSHSFVMNDVENGNCPSNCSFCKEALIARSYAESNIYETSGMLGLHWNGRDMEFPAKTKVKFWDPNVEMIVIGPLQIPVGKGWPIANESLDKLFSLTLGRMLAD